MLFDTIIYFHISVLFHLKLNVKNRFAFPFLRHCFLWWLFSCSILCFTSFKTSKIQWNWVRTWFIRIDDLTIDSFSYSFFRLCCLLPLSVRGLPGAFSLLFFRAYRNDFQVVKFNINKIKNVILPSHRKMMRMIIKITKFLACNNILMLRDIHAQWNQSRIERIVCLLNCHTFFLFFCLSNFLFRNSRRATAAWKRGKIHIFTNNNDKNWSRRLWKFYRIAL